MTQNELLAKAYEKIDAINDSIGKIEVCDIAKGNVVMPEAEVCINIKMDDGKMNLYEFNAVLPDKSLDNIKAFIMTEIDKVKDEAEKTIRLFCGEDPAPAREYVESGNSEEFFLPDDDDVVSVEVPNPEPEIYEEPKKKWSDAELLKLYEGSTIEAVAAVTGMGRSTVGKRIKAIKDAQKEEASKRKRK